MYLLAHLAYRILPSFRWMNLLPGLVLYAGLAVFLLAVTPLFTRFRAQLCLLLLATLHPQLLMWSATFRWYCPWTGLALIALTLALQPREPQPTLSPARSISIGLLLAGLFYLNYITLLFALALAAAILLRYRAQPLRQLLLRVLLALGVFAALAIPQLHTMFAVHIPNGRAQSYGLAVSCIRLLQSVAASETYLPWHPLAILADLLCAAFCVAALAAVLRLRSSALIAPKASAAAHNLPSQAAAFDGPLASIILFALAFFLLVALTGLGGKPRNGLLLIPVLAPVAALIVGSLRPRMQDAVLLFLVLWSAVGIAHLLGRYGLTKSTMNDRPEQVVAFVAQTTDSQSASPRCTVVVTYDSALAFTLAQAHLPRTLTISPFRGPLFGGARTLPPDDCDHPRLYAVTSFLGGDPLRERILNSELNSSLQYIDGPPHTDLLDFDPDAARKRSLSRLSGLSGDLTSLARLPDYRYVVTSGPIDHASLEAMRRGMTHFPSGYALNSDLDPQPRAPAE